MSKELIIGLDFDGVIVDHTANKIEAARRMGIYLVASDTPSGILKTKTSPDAYRKIQQTVYDDPSFALSAPLVSGAAQGLAELKRSGFAYFLISRQKNPQMTQASLSAHGLWQRHFSESNAFFVADTAGKDKKASELGVNVYLDDEPAVLAGLSVPQKFLFDPLDLYPPDPSYQKVRTWTEFITEIK